MRVLIADDEPLIRLPLKKGLQQLQFCDVVEAEDGLQALQFIKSDDTIQIVIADIRMPGLDGLHLLSETKKYRTDLIFIFLSGFDLFEYAQKALKLGAVGYLLKPFREDELKEILEQSLKQLQVRHSQKMMFSKLENEMKRASRHMRKHVIFELMKEHACSESYIKNKLAQVEIHLDKPCVVVLYLSIDGYQLAISEAPLAERELIKFSLENIASENIASYEVAAYCFEVEDGIGVLLNFEKSHPLAISSTLHQMCMEIKRCVQIYTRETVTIGFGLAAGSVTQLNEAFKLAEKAVMRRLISGGNNVYYYSELPEPDTGTNLISAKHELELQASFEQLNVERAKRLIDACFKPYASGSPASAERLMKLNFQLIILIFKNVSQAGVDPETEIDDEMRLYSVVYSLGGVDKVVEWFHQLIQKCFDHIRRQRDHKTNPLVAKAKEYIHQHYNQDLTLEMVASSVLLSPAHFSKMFKEEIGENFSNYVFDYRMSIAKALLKDGIYRANKVAEMIGFRDEKYFYKAFKKITGFTPSEYRYADME